MIYDINAVSMRNVVLDRDTLHADPTSTLGCWWTSHWTVRGAWTAGKILRLNATNNVNTSLRLSRRILYSFSISCFTCLFYYNLNYFRYTPFSKKRCPASFMTIQQSVLLPEETYQQLFSIAPFLHKSIDIEYQLYI